MAREILSKRNFFDFESPDSAISRFPLIRKLTRYGKNKKSLAIKKIMLMVLVGSLFHINVAKV
jgi:hypothetical protein